MALPNHEMTHEFARRLYEAAHRDGAVQVTVLTEDLRRLLTVASAVKGAEPFCADSQASESETISELEHQVMHLGQALGECIIAAGMIRADVGLTGPQLLMFAGDLKEHLASVEQSQAAYNAVISFVLANPCESPMEFLRCWNEGDFDSLREEWPEASEDIYLADSLNPKFRGLEVESCVTPALQEGSKLIERCRDLLAASSSADEPAAALLAELTAYLEENPAPTQIADGASVVQP